MKVLTSDWDKIEAFPNVYVTESQELRDSKIEFANQIYFFICSIFKGLQLNKINCVLEEGVPSINLIHVFEGETLKNYIQEKISKLIPDDKKFNVNFMFTVMENV